MKRIVSATAALIVSMTADIAMAQLACPRGVFLEGGKVYRNDGSLKQLDDPTSIDGSAKRYVSLFYVVHSIIDRSGVIVIKTARSGVALKDDRPNYGRVQMVREEAVNDCSRKQNRFDKSVRSEAYEDYHDRGLDRGGNLEVITDGEKALNTIDHFHTDYPTGRSQCMKTNSKRDAEGYYEDRSNRSQFSFDSNVVDKGYSWAVTQGARSALSWLIPPAEAAPLRFREQRVEIKRYTTVNGLACIPFGLEMRPDQILRVSDLEGRIDRERIPEARIGDRGSPRRP